MKSMFSNQKQSALEETVEISVMLRYNSNIRAKYEHSLDSASTYHQLKIKEALHFVGKAYLK